MLWQVRESVQLVTGDPVPLAVFDSFWDASDFVGEHPDQRLVIEECWPGPVITSQDIDRYFDTPGCPGGVDPRSEFEQWDIPDVLRTLGYVAQLKGQSQEQCRDMFGYEVLLYEYHDTADKLLRWC